MDNQIKRNDNEDRNIATVAPTPQYAPSVPSAPAPAQAQAQVSSESPEYRYVPQAQAEPTPQYAPSAPSVPEQTQAPVSSALSEYQYAPSAQEQAYATTVQSSSAESINPEAMEEAVLSEPRKKKGLLYFIRDIAIALLITTIILQFIKPTIVLEHSMENTLHPSDYVFLATKAYKFGGSPERGDIVVFKSELIDDTSNTGAKKNLIKRVIGIPGDTISITGGSVYRNGKAIDEPYTKDNRTDGEMDEVRVPTDMVFVMGDNRQVSKDSRSPDVGFIPNEVLSGKVFFRLFPISAMGSPD